MGNVKKVFFVVGQALLLVAVAFIVGLGVVVEYVGRSLVAISQLFYFRPLDFSKELTYMRDDLKRLFDLNK